MDKTAVRLVKHPSRWPRFGLRAILLAMALASTMMWSGVRTYQLFHDKSAVPTIPFPIYQGDREFFTDERFKTFLSSLKVAHPPTLDLSSTQLTDQSANGLKQCWWLRELDLSNTGFTDQGLAQLQNLNGLKLLFLYGTRVTYRAAWDFSQRPPHTTVYWGDAQVRFMLKFQAAGVGFETVSAESLAKLAGVTDLKSLTCSHFCGMTDQDLNHFSNFALESLDIYNMEVTDKSMNVILGFRQLRRLVLPSSITPQAARKIKEGLPQCTDFHYLGTASEQP